MPLNTRHISLHFRIVTPDLVLSGKTRTWTLSPLTRRHVTFNAFTLSRAGIVLKTITDKKTCRLASSQLIQDRPLSFVSRSKMAYNWITDTFQTSVKFHAMKCTGMEDCSCNTSVGRERVKQGLPAYLALRWPHRLAWRKHQRLPNLPTHRSNDAAIMSRLYLHECHCL